MAENKRTPEEIIKALECHSNEKNSCEDCTFWGEGCSLELCKDALDLINRQQAENERLSSSAKQWEETAKDLLISKEKQQAEIEKLEKAISYLEDVCNSTPDKVRAEAFKEVAEELKEYGTLPDLPWDIWKTFADNIDNFVKEKVGEK